MGDKMATVIKFNVTVSNEKDIDRFINALRDIGITETVEDSVVSLDNAITELFPDKTSAEVSGMILKNVREEKNLTQDELAKIIGTSRTAVTAIENGKRPVSKAMAKKLGKVFDIAYTAFL
jgi:DNA-binding XRE family transcriptional regulator